MKRSMKPLHSSGVFLYPLETSGIFSFSVDIERDQCHETDQGYTGNSFSFRVYEKRSVALNGQESFLSMKIMLVCSLTDRVY